MRGQYFSWLSHDDVYLPEKVQVEIDALRQAGDMFRVVYSNFSVLNMFSREVKEYTANNFFRQAFLETGAFTPLFNLVNGCTLLIPKFYFDVYGGFEETFRAVQDFKKWFEMFRERRLIYIRKPLVLGRVHSEQTTNKYSIIWSEVDWLYSWMTYDLKEDDLIGSGLTDLYHFYSSVFTKWRGDTTRPSCSQFAAHKMQELPESPDAGERAKNLSAVINDGNFETYLPKEQEAVLRFEFNLRGINLGDNVKFIPLNQFTNVRLAKNIRLLTRDSLLQVLIDTPIRKQLFAQWLQQQGGQRA